MAVAAGAYLELQRGQMVLQGPCIIASPSPHPCPMLPRSGPKQVDAEALGIPDYRQVVTHPMDLGTIRARLAPGAESAAGEHQPARAGGIMAGGGRRAAGCRQCRQNPAGSGAAAEQHNVPR